MYGRNGKPCGDQKGKGAVSGVSANPVPVIRRIILRRRSGLDPLSFGVMRGACVQRSVSWPVG